MLLKFLARVWVLKYEITSLRVSESLRLYRELLFGPGTYYYIEPEGLSSRKYQLKFLKEFISIEYYPFVLNNY